MSDKITDHYFERDGDGRCGFTWRTHGSGTERERCGGAEDRHIPDPSSTPVNVRELLAQVQAESVNELIAPIESIINRVLNSVNGDNISWPSDLAHRAAKAILILVEPDPDDD